MNKFLMTLHRWLGFPLGLLFVVTFGTGCLTAVDELLERFEHSRYNSHYSYKAITNDEIASAIATITQDKKGIGSITLPTKATPYYRVASRGESWTYAIDDLTHVTHKENTNDGFFQTVLQLHRNFLLGKDGFFGLDGKHYAAWVGMIALLLSIVGLWVWWPLRKSFNLKDAVPRGNKRKHYYYSHMTSGVITLIAVVLLSLTGAAITYRAIAQQLFGVDPKAPSAIQPQSLTNNWKAWIDAAYAHMPEGSQLTQIRYPRPPKGTAQRQTKQRQKNQSQLEQTNKNLPQALNLQFSTPGTWFGIVRSSVKIDNRSSTLIEVSRFENFPLKQKIYSILVPLHTGHDLPVFYVLVLLVFSLMGTLMVSSGLVSFVIKKRKRRKRFQQTSMAAVTE